MRRTALCRNRWNCTFEVLSTLRLSGGLFGLHFFVKAVQRPRQQRNVNDQIFGQLVSLERRRKDPPVGLGPARTLYHHNISLISSSGFTSERKLFHHNRIRTPQTLRGYGVTDFISFRFIFSTVFQFSKNRRPDSLMHLLCANSSIISTNYNDSFWCFRWIKEN